MVEISEVRLNICDVTKQPVHHINEVTELCEERSTIEWNIAFPVFVTCFFFNVVPIITIPETIYFHHENFSQAIFFLSHS